MVEQRRTAQVRDLIPPRRLLIALAVVVVLLASGRVLIGSRGGADDTRPTAAPSVAGEPVRVGPGTCGQGWSGGRAGVLRFALDDDGPAPADVYLQDPARGTIFLDVETIGAGAVRSASVTLPAGRYRFVCASTDTGSVAGPTVELTGSYRGPFTPGVRPVTDADLVKPVLAYQGWVRGRLAWVRATVRAMTRALSLGQVRIAQQRWLLAHRQYHTVGAAYDAFGDFGQAIDGLPRHGIPPPGDRKLTGFHKIEALLWHGARPVDVVPYADRLSSALATLRHHLGTDIVLAPIDLGLRAHEILEDALQTDLRGAADAGSHTDLATIDADITGTRRVLAVLHPLLRDRDPDLEALQRGLDRLTRTVRRNHRHGSWTPLAALSRSAREQLDAALSHALELLSGVAVITDPVDPMP